MYWWWYERWKNVWLLNQKKDVIKKFCKKVKIYGVTVGKKPSKAKFYVEKPKNVQELITGFVRASNKLSNSISTIDIRGLGLNNKYRIQEEDEINISKENEANEIGRNFLDKE